MVPPSQAPEVKRQSFPFPGTVRLGVRLGSGGDGGGRRSPEAPRQVVLDEGRAVQAAAKDGRLALAWDAGVCFVPDAHGRPTAATRVYLGADGVMVPTVTQAEKDLRRAQVRAKRRLRGRK